MLNGAVRVLRLVQLSEPGHNVVVHRGDGPVARGEGTRKVALDVVPALILEGEVPVPAQNGVPAVRIPYRPSEEPQDGAIVTAANRGVRRVNVLDGELPGAAWPYLA